MIEPRANDLAHETLNEEQLDEDAQAQTVADEALSGDLDSDVVGDSEKVRGGFSVMPEDAPDLVDTMNQMVSSGRLDYGAFAGEPVHDDEEDAYGGELEDEDAEGPRLSDE